MFMCVCVCVLFVCVCVCVLFVCVQASWPHSRFYWGYIWDGTGNRCTAPIRNPRNKSYMPEEQVMTLPTRARARTHTHTHMAHARVAHIL